MGSTNGPVGTGPATAGMKADFGAALREAMGATTAQALADHVGLTRDAVAKWMAGTTEPPPLTVFAVERFLGVTPGDLSRHLGYQPLGSPQVLAAIDADPALTDQGKAMLRAAYRAARR